MSRIHKVDKSSKDIIVAVVGPAGAGKSNFVDTTAGVPPPGSEHVGHGLGACTTDVRAVRVHHPRVEGREIILLDTPGFDEMGTTEDDVYQMIIDWTKKRYQREVRLAGIILLQRITVNRMTDPPIRNVRKFEALCGENNTRNVILVTTVWSHLSNKSVGERREAEMREGYWRKMLEYGSTTARFEDTYESAWSILDIVLTKSFVIPFLLQEEMSDLRKSLPKTESADALYKILQELLVHHVPRRGPEAPATDHDAQMQELTAKYELLVEILRITFEELQDSKDRIPLSRRIRAFLLGGSNGGGNNRARLLEPGLGA